jgi:hypothetical protein
LTNRLLGRSRTLSSPRQKGSEAGRGDSLSVQGLALFYTAKRIAQGETFNFFTKLFLSFFAPSSSAFRPFSLSIVAFFSAFFRSTARFVPRNLAVKRPFLPLITIEP